MKWYECTFESNTGSIQYANITLEHMMHATVDVEFDFGT